MALLTHEYLLGCRRSPLTLSSIILTFSSSCPCIILSPWVTKVGDLLLDNRVQQTWGDASEIWYQKDCGSRLGALPSLGLPPHSLTIFLGPLACWSASFHVMKSPVDEPAWQGTDISRRPAMEDLRPLTATWLNSGMHPMAVNSHVNECGSGSFPVRAWRGPQSHPTPSLELCEKPWTRDMELNYIQIPDVHKLCH